MGRRKRSVSVAAYFIPGLMLKLERCSRLLWGEVRLRGPALPMITQLECKGTSMLFALGEPAIGSVLGTWVCFICCCHRAMWNQHWKEYNMIQWIAMFCRNLHDPGKFREWQRRDKGGCLEKGKLGMTDQGQVEGDIWLRRINILKCPEKRRMFQWQKNYLLGR